MAELLEPPYLQQQQQQLQQSTSSGGGVATQGQAEMLLVLHQLTWLFAAMQAVLQLCGTLDFAAASSLKQEALETALDVLRVVSEGCGRPDSGSTGSSTYSASAAQYACTSAVLGLLAVPGQLSLAEGQTQQLLSVLASLAGQHEGLHVVLAGVLGSLGMTAKSGQQAYQVCACTSFSGLHGVACTRPVLPVQSDGRCCCYRGPAAVRLPNFVEFCGRSCYSSTQRYFVAS